MISYSQVQGPPDYLDPKPHIQPTSTERPIIMTTFDPASFLNMTVDQANDTKSIPCPAGEYLAIADKVDIKPWAARDGSSSGLKVEILWDIQDDNVKQLLDRETVKVPQQQMLDLTETGMLDTGKGKNIGLGRIREALDLNKPGEPFAFSMIQGRMAKVIVSHRTVGEDAYAEIKKIAAPA